MKQYFTKENIKTALNRILFYVVSNLATLGIYVAIFLPIVMSGYMEQVDQAIGKNITDMIVNAGISIGGAFAFLFVFFLNDHEYKSFYISKDKENLPISKTFIAHIKQFGIFDLVWFGLLTIVFVIICIVPGGLNSFISFGYASATFFIMTIELPSIVIPLWILFNIGTYLASIYFAHKIWHRQRRKLLKSLNIEE